MLMVWRLVVVCMMTMTMMMIVVMNVSRWGHRGRRRMLVSDKIMQPRRTNDGIKAIDGENQSGEESRPHVRHDPWNVPDIGVNRSSISNLRLFFACRWRFRSLHYRDRGDDFQGGI